MYKNRDKVKPISIMPPLSRGLGDYSSNVQVNIEKIKDSVSHLESSNVSVYNSNVVLHNIDLTLDNIDGKISTGNEDSISGEIQQVLTYGRFDNDGSLKAVKTSSDGSIITAPAGGQIISSDGTTSEQRVMILGNSSGNLRTIKCDGNGALIVDPSKEGIITSDGTTTALHTMMLGNHNGNLRTVKVGEDGAIATELDYSWDNNTTIFTTETIADGASATSATFDLGQGVSHEPGAVEFFHTNSASVEIEVTAEVSPDGTDWYSLDGVSFSATKQYVSHNQEEVGISIGHRYMRLVVSNNDGLGTSTNITTRVAYYK